MKIRDIGGRAKRGLDDLDEDIKKAKAVVKTKEADLEAKKKVSYRKNEDSRRY